ncbi:response regulator [candidate division KSB1 bacterium]|nr:response regulator [candidate division KSB1 bacterium]
MIPHPKGTLLLVEDDTALQENLAVVFRIAGYDALFAANAQEGFAALGAYQIDLVVLDHQLLGTNGLQFFEVLVFDQQFSHLRDLPVVVFTGVALSEEQKRSYLRFGAKAIIAKGTGFNDLVRIIDREVETYKLIANFDRIAPRRFSLPEYLNHIEKQIILRALIKNPACSQDSIAKELGIPRSTLSRKMGEYQIRLK